MKKILLLVLLMGFGATAHADTLTLQPGPAEGKDSFYGTAYYLNNMGDSEILYTGGWGDIYQSYLQFDVTSIPTNATITTADLTLTEFTTGRNQNNLKFTNISEPWLESSVSNTQHPTATGTATQWLPMSASSSQTFSITDLVHDWVAQPQSNFGLMAEGQYHSNNHARGFRSSDYLADPTLRPKLVVEYTVPTSTVPTFVTLSEDVMTEIANDIEYPSVLPIYEGLMDKVVQAYERGHLVRSDRRLERFKTYIREGLGKLLFSKAERKTISAIISDMQNILVTEG
jgi:hypothetical protein